MRSHPVGCFSFLGKFQIAYQIDGNETAERLLGAEGSKKNLISKNS
jgi:hypothetical protein